jgi:hypothetical protein
MKTYIENKPLQRAFIAVLIIFVVGMAIFFTIKYHQFKNEVKDYESRSLSGIVMRLKDLKRGDYYLYLKQGTIVNRYTFPNFHDYIDKVQIDDSLYKPANSAIFQLYKKEGVGFSFGGTLKVEY